MKNDRLEGEIRAFGVALLALVDALPDALKLRMGINRPSLGGRQDRSTESC